MAEARVLIAGGGLAGLGAALALRRAAPGLLLDVLEQAEQFSEVGAGIQLGPNAVRVLRDWGLEAALNEVAAFPTDLLVRDAASGASLGHLPLAERAQRLYGAPYATIHRADLHALLLQALQAEGGTGMHLLQRIEGVQLPPEAGGPLELRTQSGQSWSAAALLGCDGLRSRVREQLLGDATPRFSGHLAYRGLVKMTRLPPELRQTAVTAWLGPRMHAVHYPVRAGEWLNVVVVVQGDLPTEHAGWDHPAQPQALWQAMGLLPQRDLHRVLEAVPLWRLWPLFGRNPVAGAREMARGSVALLGDAAHPMKPYLAQGAAMALEDAWVLGRLLGAQGGAAAAADLDWPRLLERWAQARWRRCAWVQARSQRNGTIFHASGPMRWGRDGAMRLLGPRLIDVPRLYAGPPLP